MEEKAKDGNKPKREKLAIWSPVLTILAVALAIISDILGLDDTPLFYLILFLLITLPILGIIFGIVSYYRIDKSKGKYYGRLFAGLGITIPFVLFVLFILPHRCPTAETARKIVCRTSLNQMGKVMLVYLNENNKFPSGNWCDVVFKKYADSNDIFVCVGAKRADIEGKCHYAINSSAEPNSPDDTVLLFDSKAGWNNYGKAELLAPENHDGKGCNIVFVDGHTTFVKVEDFNDLRWK